jgi:hypothetical protein
MIVEVVEVVHGPSFDSSVRNLINVSRDMLMIVALEKMHLDSKTQVEGKY